MSTLFFDGAASGHHGEFLENLIDGLSECTSREFWLLAHPELESRLRAFKELLDSHVQLVFLSEEEVAYLEAAKGIVQIGRRQLEVLSKYVNRLRVDRVVLMHMNLHQYALHRWKLGTAVEIVGVLLNPYTPISRAYGLRAKLFAGFTGIRKRLQFLLMLRNSRIKQIFLLNDERMARQLNKWHRKRPVFTSVADPLPARWSKLDPVQSAHCESMRPFTFLLAGSMAPRKGCLEVLDALMCLNENLGRPVCLRIVGRFRVDMPEYSERVLAKMEELGSRTPHVTVRLEDTYLDSAAMSREFAGADCVLVPYLEFYGSSGMIGHACRYQKPLLSCRDGLLGELVREMKLGLCVNPRDAVQLAGAMSSIISGEYDYDASAAERYVARADPKEFAKRLIGAPSQGSNIDKNG